MAAKEEQECELGQKKDAKELAMNERALFVDWP